MAHHGFGGTHPELFASGMLSKDIRYGLGFFCITRWGRGSVSVNVINLALCQLCVVQRKSHGALGAFPVRHGFGNVVRVTRGAVPDYLSQNSRATRPSV